MIDEYRAWAEEKEGATREGSTLDGDSIEGSSDSSCDSISCSFNAVGKGQKARKQKKKADNIAMGNYSHQ